jgi:hypothetical protein
MLRTVYVTMQPDTPYLVEDEEYTDLERQGLLIPGRGDVPPIGPVELDQAPPPFTLPTTPDTKEESGGGTEEESEAHGGQDAQPAD